MSFPHREEEIHRSATDYDKRLQLAIRKARDLPEEVLERLPVDAAAEAVVNECAAAPVVVDHAGLWLDSKEAPPRRGHEHEEWRVIFSFNVTVDGATHALTQHAARAGLPLSSRTVGDQPSTVTLSFVGTNDEMAMLDSERLRQSIDDFHERIRQAAEAANEEINAHRAQVREQVTAILESRARRIKAFKAATSALGIPVAPRMRTNGSRCDPAH